MTARRVATAQTTGGRQRAPAPAEPGRDVALRLSADAVAAIERRIAAPRAGNQGAHELPAADAAPRRVGLLGGSFNPAHAGHAHISRLALARLGLDEVWWLVSPQNPLKPAAGMAPLADRLAGARAVAEPGVRVTALEVELGTRYTADTVTAIRHRWPGFRFVWLAGADLLLEMPRWRRWRHLFRLIPVAVFARGPLVYRAVCGRAARRFAAAQIDERHARALAMARPPAWMMLDTPRHPASATRIRAGRTQP